LSSLGLVPNHSETVSERPLFAHSGRPPVVFGRLKSPWGICTWLCSPGSATCPDAPLPIRSHYPVAVFKMQSARICVALTVILVSCSFSGPATSQTQPKPSEIESADGLFQDGKFAEAGELYSRIAAQNPKDYSALLQLGRLALLSNRLDDARKWLKEVIDLKPDDADAKVMLAEAFYRSDDFQHAAASLNGVNGNSNRLIVSQYPTLNAQYAISFRCRPLQPHCGVREASESLVAHRPWASPRRRRVREQLECFDLGLRRFRSLRNHCCP
jgi:tetratricopeptide (TPR) repeat protein